MLVNARTATCLFHPELDVCRPRMSIRWFFTYVIHGNVRFSGVKEKWLLLEMSLHNRGKGTTDSQTKSNRYSMGMSLKIFRGDGANELGCEKSAKSVCRTGSQT
jgi:hypothetical protein